MRQGYQSEYNYVSRYYKSRTKKKICYLAFKEHEILRKLYNHYNIFG